MGNQGKQVDARGANIGIIGDYGTIINPLPPPVIPDQRPAPEPCFLHREEEITWLNERLLPGAVVAVCGPGGMGKSALAAQAVSRLEAARFPDGIVFHSFYHQPGTEQALQAVCAAFEVEAKTDLVGGVRQALSGRKALLMLDGTEEADDLQAVLRLRGQCGVLITSRRNEDAPDAPLELRLLDEEQAEEVFLRYSGPVDDLTSVRAICKLLNGWPVALRIAGRYLRNRKESAAAYLRWLEKRPFRMLGSGAHQEDNMALLLERSTAQVSAEAKQVLQLAGVLAFAPIALGPVMAVLGKEDEDPDDLELRSVDALGELVNYGLLERKEERWQTSHALIHTYARTELALSTDALKRLAEWYIAFCEAASKEGVQGYARLDEERAHCLRLIESCLESKLWQEVKLLVRVIHIYLDLQGWWTERLTALEMRLDAARQADDYRDKGWCLNELGFTCRKRGEHDKALIWYEQSLPIWRKLGDQKEEGTVLNNIGAIYQHQEKYKQALDYYQQSLSIRREIGNRQGEGTSLNNIATVYHNQGAYEQALSSYEQCLPIRQEAGDKIGVGGTLNNIGSIYYSQGKFRKALEYQEQSLAIRREQGDRPGEAQSCYNVGTDYEQLGDLARAEEYISRAVEIKEAIGTPDAQECRNYLEQLRAERRGK